MDRRACLAGSAALLAVPLIRTLAGALLAAPLAAEAQKAGKVYRIGVLETTPNPRMEDVLRQGLRELGWVNLIFERRYSEGRDDRHPDTRPN